MIQRGRIEGWLREPVSALPAWAGFYGVSFDGIRIGVFPGLEDRGSTVGATRKISASVDGPLITVPPELIISRLNVEMLAKADHHLRDVLDCVREFGRVRSSSDKFSVVNSSRVNRPPGVPYCYS